MKLRIRPPKGRSVESLERHYRTEKQIADRLRAASSPEVRKQIMETMYDELFRAVPDHPRLTRRSDPAETLKANQSKLRLLEHLLEPSTAIAEFGSGDCMFLASICDRVRSVYAIDISDQRAATFEAPRNFFFVGYDGYSMPSIQRQSIDVCFSDMLLEHLHPHDVSTHLDHVLELLKPGGLYVFRTPHAQSGPDDVSRFFSDVAQGFHLQEWTYGELIPLLKARGFDSFRPYWNARTLLVPIPLSVCVWIERALRWLPGRLRTTPAKLILPSVCLVATKKTSAI